MPIPLRALLAGALLAGALLTAGCSQATPATPAPEGADVTEPPAVTPAPAPAPAGQTEDGTPIPAGETAPDDAVALDAPADVPFGKAVAVVIGGQRVKLQVTSVTTTSVPDFMRPFGDASNLLVTYRVTNESSSPLDASSIAPLAVYYGPDAQAAEISSADAEAPITATRLQPGKTARGAAAWAIPKGQKQVLVAFWNDALSEVTFAGTVAG